MNIGAWITGRVARRRRSARLYLEHVELVVCANGAVAAGDSDGVKFRITADPQTDIATGQLP